MGSYPKVMIFYVESCLILTFLSCVPSLNGKVAARSPSLMGSLCRCVFVDGMNFKTGAPNGNFRENICSEDDLRTRIFGTFVVKFIACLPLLGFSSIYKMV